MEDQSSLALCTLRKHILLFKGSCEYPYLRTTPRIGFLPSLALISFIPAHPLNNIMVNGIIIAASEERKTISRKISSDEKRCLSHLCSLAAFSTLSTFFSAWAICLTVSLKLAAIIKTPFKIFLKEASYRDNMIISVGNF